MAAPVHRLKKDDIIWLSNHKCAHSMSYLEHYNCYLKENPQSKKIGYIDIESSNLKANFGVMLCYCIKVKGSDEVLVRAVSKAEVNSKSSPDYKVVKQCVEDMQTFDLLYGFYSSRFDIPFIRTRAQILGIDFPSYGAIKHKDVYFIIRNKFCLHSNRLEVACRELLGHTDKSHLDGNIWRRALQGDQEAITYVVEHCKADVIDLEKLTDKVLDYVGPMVNSI